MTAPLDSFLAAALEHGRHTLQGYARKANAAYRNLYRARETLRTEVDQGKGALMDLLAHPDASVRTWAALFLLPSKVDDALAALDAIGSGEDLLALGARITASEWRAGRLQVI
jgi:hypothetical protein